MGFQALQVLAEPLLTQFCGRQLGLAPGCSVFAKFLESGRISCSVLLISHSIRSTAHQIGLQDRHCQMGSTAIAYVMLKKTPIRIEEGKKNK